MYDEDTFVKQVLISEFRGEKMIFFFSRYVFPTAAGIKYHKGGA